MTFDFIYLDAYEPLWANAANKIKGDPSKKFVFIQGGAGSGKTIDIIIFALSHMANIRGFECIIFRKTLNECRNTVFKDAKNAAEFSNQAHLFSFHGGETGTMLVKCPSTGSKMHFAGVDDPEKIKGIHAGIQLIIADELTSFKASDLKEMNRRIRCPYPGALNQILCSFNPIDKRNWVYRDIIEGGMYMDNALYLITTYKDNPLLPKDYVEAIEALIEEDPQSAECYTYGRWVNKYEHTIYKHFKTIPYQRKGRFVYGLDFGDEHPTALAEVNIRPKRSRLKRGELHARQLIYEKNLPNDKLIERMQRTLKIPTHATIVCDSARSDLIKQIQKVYPNAIGVKKGAGSVYDGIQIVKSFDIFIDEESSDLIGEMEGYRWKVDKNGESTGKPVKMNDDLMDAMRYAVMFLTKKMNLPAIGIYNSKSSYNKNVQGELSAIDKEIEELSKKLVG